MPRLLVIPLSALEDSIANHRPSHLVSLLSPQHMIETPKGFPVARHLKLGINDVADPAGGEHPPSAAHVEKLLAFARDWDASAPLLIESLDFSDLVRLSTAEDWQRAGEVLVDSARRLEAAGATALLIAANSMHKVYDAVAEAVSIPILHIADCVGEKMAAGAVSTAALFGTSNVMTESFYRRRLVAR